MVQVAIAAVLLFVFLTYKSGRRREKMKRKLSDARKS
jgi:hypothetical protein